MAGLRKTIYIPKIPFFLFWRIRFFFWNLWKTHLRASKGEPSLVGAATRGDSYLRPPADVIEAAEFLQQHAHELENSHLGHRGELVLRLEVDQIQRSFCFRWISRNSRFDRIFFPVAGCVSSLDLVEVKEMRSRWARKLRNLGSRKPDIFHKPLLNWVFFWCLLEFWRGSGTQSRFYRYDRRIHFFHREGGFFLCTFGTHTQSPRCILNRKCSPCKRPWSPFSNRSGKGSFGRHQKRPWNVRTRKR